MSGRSGFRKTDRKVAHRRAPHEMPPKRLTFTLPAQLALVSAGEFHGVIGVTVKDGGGVEITGSDRAWMMTQAAAFLRKIAKGHGTLQITATYENPAEDPAIAEQPRRAGWRETYTITIAAGNPVTVISGSSFKPMVFA